MFGFMEMSMKGLIFRGIGIIRAKANVAMTNLVYNMFRKESFYIIISYQDATGKKGSKVIEVNPQYAWFFFN